jgi:T5SS/PEP-CTERM-associated repeat protein
MTAQTISGVVKRLALLSVLYLLAWPVDLTADTVVTGDVTPDQSAWFFSDVHIGDTALGGILVEDVYTRLYRSAYLGFTSTAEGQVSVTGAAGQLSIGNDLFIGADGIGILSASGGALVTSGNAYIARNVGSTGQATFSGANTRFAVGDLLYAGYSGDATVLIEQGAIFNSDDGYLGVEAGSSGQVTITGTDSTWNVSGELTVGQQGSGTLVIADNALVDVTGQTKLGTDGGTGSILFTDGTLHTQMLWAGVSQLTGIGTVNTAGIIADGLDLTFDASHGTQQSVVLSTQPTQQITFNIDLDPDQTFGAGYKGAGSLTVAEGQVLTNRIGLLGVGASSQGTATVSGPGSTWQLIESLMIGDAGSAYLTIDNGGAVFAPSIEFGSQVGSTATSTVSGINSILSVDQDMIVARDGDSSLSIENGARVEAANIYLSYVTGEAAVSVSGASSILNTPGDLYVGYSGRATLEITDGASVEVGGDTVMPYIGNAQYKKIIFDNGELHTASLWAEAPQLFGTGTIYSHGIIANDTTLRFDAFNGSQKLIKYDALPDQDITILLDQTAEGALGVGWYAGSGTILIEDGVTVNSRSGHIAVGRYSTGNAYVSGSGSTWAITEELHIGQLGIGELIVSDGGQVTFTDAFLGYEEDAEGRVTVTGTGSGFTGLGDISVGHSRRGQFDVTGGGSVSNVDSFIGNDQNAIGTVRLSGADSSWTNTGTLNVGYSGSGAFNVNNGAQLETQNGSIGQQAYSDGEVNISGTGTTWTNHNILWIGRYGEGIVRITDGATVNVTRNIEIGRETDSYGELLVSGSGTTLRAEDAILVGDRGDARMDVVSGATVYSDSLVIGDSNGDGVVNISGSGTSWINTGGFSIGEYGEGTLLISDGAVVTSPGAAIANGPTSALGTVTVSGPGTSWIVQGGMRVGDDGRGTLNVLNGATVENSSGVTLGYRSYALGVAHVSGTGSLWSVGDSLKIGEFNDGELYISDGGQVTVDNEVATGFRVSGGNNLARGLINFDNGTLETKKLSVGSDDLFGHGTIYAEEFIADGTEIVYDATHGLQQTLQIQNNPGQNITLHLDQTNSLVHGAGYSSEGAMAIRDGFQLNSVTGYLGYLPGSYGTAVVSGPGSTWSLTDVLYVGNQGEGELLIDGGATIEANAIVLGKHDGSKGTLTVRGADTELDTYLHIGEDGEAVMNILEGAYIEAPSAYIGDPGPGNGSPHAELNLDGQGSTLEVRDRLLLGNASLYITNAGAVKVIGEFDNWANSTIHMSTGGMLGIRTIDDTTDDSLEDFLALFARIPDLRYWDDSTQAWTDINQAARDTEYWLEYQYQGPFVGYTLITVGTPVENLAADLDGDGFVGIADLNLILGNWNANVTQGDLLSGDPSGDGFVGIDDLNQVLGNWNAGTPLAVNTTPEPATFSLLALAGVAMLRRPFRIRGAVEIDSHRGSLL